MAPRGAQSKAHRVTTDALLVRRVAYGEADLIVTFFTEALGIVLLMILPIPEG